MGIQPGGKQVTLDNSVCKNHAKLAGYIISNSYLLRHRQRGGLSDEGWSLKRLDKDGHFIQGDHHVLTAHCRSCTREEVRILPQENLCVSAALGCRDGLDNPHLPQDAIKWGQYLYGLQCFLFFQNFHLEHA